MDGSENREEVVGGDGDGDGEWNEGAEGKARGIERIEKVGRRKKLGNVRTRSFECVRVNASRARGRAFVYTYVYFYMAE